MPPVGAAIAAVGVATSGTVAAVSAIQKTEILSSKETSQSERSL